MIAEQTPAANAPPVQEPGYTRLVLYTPVRAYPGVADGKATALLGAYGLIISVLLVFMGPIGEIIQGQNFAKAMFVSIILAPLLALLLIGMWKSLRALTMPVPPMPTSMAYFQHIAGRPFQEYHDAMCGFSWREALRQLMHHHYTLAVLCRKKFALVETGVHCLSGAFVLWLLLLMVLTLGGKA